MRACLHKENTLVEYRDFFKEPFSEYEIRELLKNNEPSDIFSWNSPSAKKLSPKPSTDDQEYLLTLMLDDPRLIKRPILLVDNTLLFVGAKLIQSEEVLSLIK